MALIFGVRLTGSGYQGKRWAGYREQTGLGDVK